MPSLMRVVAAALALFGAACVTAPAPTPMTSVKHELESAKAKP